MFPKRRPLKGFKTSRQTDWNTVFKTKQFPSSRLSAPKARMRGIGLPATIFIITVLALIVVAITDLTRQSAQGFSQSFQSQRAFYAAESGAQVALNRIFVGGTACNASLADINFNSQGANEGLDGCVAQLSCSQITINSTSYYTVDSVGQCGVGLEQAQRSVQVRARSN